MKRWLESQMVQIQGQIDRVPRNVARPGPRRSGFRPPDSAGRDERAGQIAGVVR
jgi:hypothetical protein